MKIIRTFSMSSMLSKMDTRFFPCRFGWTGLSCLTFLTFVFHLAPVQTLVAQENLPPAVDRQIDFVKDIQPILKDRCYACHGNDRQRGDLRWDVKALALKGGHSGPPVRPGNSAESPLIRMVAGLVEPDKIMPKDGPPLSAGEIGLLRAWIDQGADWPDGLEPEGYAPKEALWSLKPVQQPELPEVQDSDWANNPIDFFILKKFKEQGLTPSPEADRATLIRRLSFDLIGLPPTPDEVRAFVNDDDPKAYERLVERLLGSARYGERWARHWLDVVRFAESHGFETNLERKNAWPYRDYVIQAFNDDKPFDRFIMEQLAGDSLGTDAATGFLVGGPFDVVKSPDVNLTRQQRMDELDDMVATTGSAFLGLTVGCARCHDHKFDPISQRDYYEFQAIFAGVQHGERTMDPPDKAERVQKVESLRDGVVKIENQLEDFLPLANPSLEADAVTLAKPNPKKNELVFPPVTARWVRFTIHETINGAEPCIDELEIYQEDQPDRNVALAEYGASALASGTYAGNPSHKLEHINDGKYGNSRSWISNEQGRGYVEIDFGKAVSINRLIWGRDRQGAYSDRLPLVYTIEAAEVRGTWERIAGVPALRQSVQPTRNVERIAPVKTQKVRFTILSTLDHSEPCLDELEVYSLEGNRQKNIALADHGTKATSSGNLEGAEGHALDYLNDGKVGNAHSWISNQPGQGWVQLEFPEPMSIYKMIWGRDRTGKLNDRLPVDYRIEVETKDGEWIRVAGANDRKKYEEGKVSPVNYSSKGLDDAGVKEFERLLAEKERMEKEIEQLMDFPAIYAGRFEKPEATHLLYRGDPMQPKDEVPPAGLAKVGQSFVLEKDTPEKERRLALARWVVDEENPLTARVAVNRLWHYHFGAGIVHTPSDFGNNGGEPTHPELLDWLASEFMNQGWKMKAMHRLIVSSSTYRQSSQTRPEAFKVDASSRFLWRYPPRRLEAEALRDAILAVSGNLNLSMGGPGFHLFKPNENYVKVYMPKDEFGPEEWRRMVYQSKPRMELDDTFGVFDCPDGAQVAPKRNESITPLQVFSLLNSPFIQEQVGKFSNLLEQKNGNDIQAQVELGFWRAFGRPPDAHELSASVQVIQEHGLAPFCKTLLNANEFLYIF